MSDNTKFTVIVPTRERADVLGPSLKTLAKQDYDNLHILVSDNYSNDSTRDVVDSLNDPRITYLNTGRRLSMSHNWEFALSHVTDGWVAIIGDDDGLLPGAITKAAQISRELDVQAIGSRCAAYTWPNMPDHSFGKLTISLCKGVEIHDPKRQLLRVIQGHAPYSSLPMLYTGGFVNYGLIEQARRIDGSFYHSMIPDVYSAIVFAKLTNRYAFSNEPLAIGGSSRHSGGTSYMSKGKSTRLSESPAGKFISETNIPFHKVLVESGNKMFPPSIELLIYESLLQAEYIEPSYSSLTTHSEQLAIALGRAKRRHHMEIAEWANQFARHHTLDINSINRKAQIIRLREKLFKALRTLNEKRTTVNISGTSLLPIKDVYEASILASEILNKHLHNR